ncbi:PleD family two-component system response regulator [Roseococcus sp. DSY-14]|uniref:PleD family two-component system response regulator n=1 Tax=Roseococcus sp. DSY-14 TaxID=3369650 RepID=UPI00387AC481
MTARILAVDDIAANLRLLEAKLVSEFYEVLLASSGPEALQAAAAQLPDVILLDVMMPGMDGYEVCRVLKANPRTQHIPVVMVTALTDPTERVRGLEAGADDFLSKPVDNATLFARLRALLRVKQVQDAWRLRAETVRDLGVDGLDGGAVSIAGARALLLDEEGDEAAAVTDALAQDGIAVTRAHSPEECWNEAMTGRYDLALLSMPEEGAEMLRLASRFRAHGETRDLPLLLLADLSQKAQVLRGFDLGANDHAFRPLDPNELRARARNQVRRKRYQERLRAELDRSLEMAVTDQLTGLRNRRYVRRHLDSLLRSEEVGVLLVDIDRFKSINDTHGHAVGDVALREVAARLKGQIRAADVVARYGGEEFLLVLTGARGPFAMAVAERLREVVADQPVASGRLSLPVTISVGVATGGPNVPADALIEAADRALYRAKAEGRNCVRLGSLERTTAD